MLLDIETSKKILELVPDSILLVDKIGTIQYLNKQVNTLFGYQEQELIGKNIEIIVPKIFIKNQEKNIIAKKKTGETFAVEISLNPINFDSQPYLTAIIRDISYKKLLEKKLKEKTEELEQFVYIASHNLQEPLKSIEQLLILLNEEGQETPKENLEEIYARIRRASFHMSKLTKDILIFSRLGKKPKLSKLEEKTLELEQFVYIASHNLQEPLKSIEQLLNLLNEDGLETSKENLQKIYSRIRRASTHMSDLIKDLLLFSRLGKNPELKMVDCNKAVNTVKESLKALIEKNHAKINILGTLPTLSIYETEFEVLLQNLLDNAIKFHLPNVDPVITIKGEKRANDSIFSIEDNGIGIEEQFISKLFLMFQRFQNQKDFSGNGIGLAHCKKVIDIFGGDIWVKSILGKGSTFYFTIPNVIKEQK
jgi:light-regulated signal transduction histidine kinase (bacteriophytochrome)